MTSSLIGTVRRLHGNDRLGRELEHAFSRFDHEAELGHDLRGRSEIIVADVESMRLTLGQIHFHGMKFERVINPQTPRPATDQKQDFRQRELG